LIALDGAVENFLYTVVTELRGALNMTKNQTFHNLWKAADDAAKEATSKTLPLATEMRILHENRNMAQHNATIPDKATIQRSIVYTSDFLAQSFSLCFQVSINDLHLAEAINDKGLKKILLAAEDAMNTENHQNSVLNSTHALAILKSRVQDCLGQRGESGFIREDIKRATRGLVAKPGDRETTQRLEAVLNSFFKKVAYVEDMIATLGLGVNLQEYYYLEKDMPEVALMLDGSARFNLRGKKYDGHDVKVFQKVNRLSGGSIPVRRGLSLWLR